MLPPIPNSDYWGKLANAIPGDRSTPIVAWHPLLDHCADVAACAVALLGLRPDSFTPSLLNRRLATLGGLDHLDQGQVSRLGVLAGFHDLGKFNHGFQGKALGPTTPFTAGHVSEALRICLPECTPWCEHLALALDAPTLDGWAAGTGVWELLAAAISHHGRPAETNLDHSEVVLRCWAATATRDPFRGIAGLRTAMHGWLPSAWLETRPLPRAPSFQHGFCGLVQLADWLGSDTEFFPFTVTAEDRWDFALASASRAVEVVGLDAASTRVAMAKDPGFDRVSLYAPRPMQSAIGTIPLPTAPSLTLIEEETGGGKTEAALWHFARLFAAGAVDGIYFALPTRTAATQIYTRILTMAQLCFPDPATRPAVIMAVPGYLDADGISGKALPHFDVLWNDNPTDAQRHRRWAAESSKRFLAGTIVVGTIDQALLAALAVSHAHLRSTCLLRHLLVVDEVHASDVYMTRLLAELLTRTRSAGGHALLMSATLGAVARDVLTATWGLAPTGTTQSAAIAMPYPMLLSAGTAPQSVARTGRDRQVTLSTAPADGVEHIVQRALAAARSGARVLIIRNLVRDCLATQLALEHAAPPELLWRVSTPNGLVAAPHHARFARDDRGHLDRELEAAFGRNAKRDGGLIACATQTVQQALDLDADWMITDLAPVDVLLQRLGRLHRHDRPRPFGYTAPSVCILLPGRPFADWLGQPRRGPHGWGTVYEDLRVLEATRRLVQEGSWAIPQDNRRLVEAATHPTALAAIDPTEPRWAKHGDHLLGKSLSQRERARLGLLPWHIGFDDPQVCFARTDLRPDDPRTRLGEDDRRVVLDPPATSPFGLQIRELTLKATWCWGIPHDAEASVTCNAGCMQVHLGVRDFRYDRLGLRTEDHHGQG